MVGLLSLDLRSPSLAVVSGGPGVVLELMLGAALVLARPGWIGTILAFLALLFLGHLAVAGASDPATAAVVGAALLLIGELSQWSMDGRLVGSYDARLQVSRCIGVAWLTLLAIGALVLSLVAAGLPIAGGIVTVVVGMGAAVALLGLFSAVAARAPIGTGRRDAA
ncbi:MAG TPA: hypothetical protein VE011_10600 [Candidatus Dormibacteraeota bacterium]|nr:hypothetical protein [Candidatus Dormibacteraeota bacterium]